ncbi:DUF4336 domain-containing protein [Sandaracinus amylolyticus]|nr:DUF4336 domain-containing protein [Sandaracinus amylolyticus]
MSLKRTMTIVRLADGRLVVHSGIALGAREMERIEAWGAPAFLVVPNAGHRLDAKAYAARYPHARVVAPRGAKKGVEEVVHVDATYADVDVGDASVRFETLAGVDEGEGAMIVRSDDGVTVVLNDCVMNMDRKRDPLGFFFTTLLGSAPGPRVSRLVRRVFVKDRSALRRDLERLAALPDLTRLVVSHEKVAHGAEARRALERAATYL